MSSTDDTKIDEFKELIKKYGIKKATKIIKDKGISYDENFTESHRIDPIFSEPHIIPPRVVVPVTLEETFEKNIIDGNLLPVLMYMIGNEPKRLPAYNSIYDHMRYVFREDGDLLTGESESDSMLFPSPYIVPSFNK